MQTERFIPLRFFLCFFVFLPGMVSAADVNVVYTSDTDCTDDNACDFQSALDFAASNGEADILTLPSTLAEPGGIHNIGLGYVYTSDQGDALTINGDGVNSTIIAGSRVDRVLTIRDTGGSAIDPAVITLSNLTIKRGWTSTGEGGGLYLQAQNANVTVDSVHLVENEAGINGGGAWIGVGAFGSGSATIRNSVFAYNQASDGGGLYVSFPVITLESNVFENNTIRGSCRGGGAFVFNRLGPVTITDNWFEFNRSESGAVNCSGSGFYLDQFGPLESLVENNRISYNQLGESGNGAGAAIDRTDGPVKLYGNLFRENGIGGFTAGGIDGVGGALWLNLIGSFAEGTVINNAFIGNYARFTGYVAWIYSLDGFSAVVFANNTLNANQSMDQETPGWSAVHFDAPAVHVFNNLFRPATQFQPGDDVFVADRAFSTETVLMTHNNLLSFSVPCTPGPNCVTSPNLNESATGIASSREYHIEQTSPMIDAGTEYPQRPAVDIDGQARLTGSTIDIGADEFGPSVILEPSTSRFNGQDVASGGVSQDALTITIANVGTEDVTLSSVSLEDVANTDWTIVSGPVAGETLAAGMPPVPVTIKYEPISRRSSSNRLIVETSALTVTQTLTGLFTPLPDSDSDGLSDDNESGPEHNDEAYDGNCDGVPDRLQVNVASLETTTGHYVTLVAPREDQRIGSGDWHHDPFPFFMDVRAVPATEGGGGPSVDGYNARAGFFSFRVSNSRGMAGETGEALPVTIILPGSMLGQEVDAYIKNGPVPAEGWFSGAGSERPDGDDGLYNFTAGEMDRHVDIWSSNAGAVGEPVGGLFPWFDEDTNEWICAPSERPVIHLRLTDGKIGDHDLVANGIVLEPGGPVSVPPGDADLDGILNDSDNCPTSPNPDQADGDSDGVGDVCDNCVVVANGALLPDAGGHSQRDTDADGYGNICDPDFTNELLINAADLSYMKSNFFTTDADADLTGDGIVNAADLAIMKSMFFGAPGPSGLVP